MSGEARKMVDYGFIDAPKKGEEKRTNNAASQDKSSKFKEMVGISVTQHTIRSKINPENSHGISKKATSNFHQGNAGNLFDLQN